MSIIKNGKKIAGLYKADLITPATDTQAGIIKIATEEEVQGGISNNTAITPYQLANQSPKTLVDDLTIIKDDNNTITTIGVKSKTDTILYDWIGTKSEYNMAYEAGEIKENWICWITDDEVQHINQTVSDIALLDMIVSNHILEGEEKIGKELQGTLILKSIYPNAYNKLLKAYKTATKVTEEIAGISVTYKKCTNKWNIIDISNKSVYDQLFETTGSANFFVIDTDSETFYLPKTNNFFQPTTDANKVNSFTEAGLPNIEGSGLRGGQDGTSGGAFVKAVIGQSNGASGNFGANYSFNASLSNPIYGNSDTVQPASNNVFIYYKVGTTVVESGEIVNITTENDTTPLFTGLYFDFTPNNVSWLKAGQQANSGGIYEFVYAELVNELILPKYGLKVIETKDMVSGEDYSLYWKVNQDDMTFTTPLLDGSEDIIDYTQGQDITSGYIAPYRCIGYAHAKRESNNFAKVFVDGVEAYRGQMSGEMVSDCGTQFDIPQGATVTTSGTLDILKVYPCKGNGSLYFKVANVVQNLELLDAGEVLEAVNNVVPNNRELIASYGNPDYDKAISLSTNTTFIPDVDGIVEYDVSCASTNHWYLCLGESMTNTNRIAGGAQSNTQIVEFAGQVRVNKGVTYYIKSNGATVYRALFVPLKGAN